MKAFVRAEYGSPGVLKLDEVDRPVPKDDEVLVCVLASSLNQGDLDYLYGKPFLTRLGTGLRAPRQRGLGFGAAGEVEAVGKDVTGFQHGDAVFGDLTQYGHSAFAEYAAAHERAWAHKPSSMSYEEAATLPQAAILAIQGLRGRGAIAPGNSVLVNGASGSVGPFAVQVAKSFPGVCTSCSEALRARIFACLFFGPLISLVERKRMGFLWWKPFHQEDVEFLKRLIAAGRVEPVIDRTYPLIKVREALAYLQTGNAQGKVVITSATGVVS